MTLKTEGRCRWSKGKGKGRGSPAGWSIPNGKTPGVKNGRNQGESGDVRTRQREQGRGQKGPICSPGFRGHDKSKLHLGESNRTRGGKKDKGTGHIWRLLQAKRGENGLDGQKDGHMLCWVSLAKKRSLGWKKKKITPKKKTSYRGGGRALRGVKTINKCPDSPGGKKTRLVTGQGGAQGWLTQIFRTPLGKNMRRKRNKKKRGYGIKMERRWWKVMVSVQRGQKKKKTSGAKGGIRENSGHVHNN